MTLAQDYLQRSLSSLCSNTKLQCDVAMLSLSGVGVEYKGLLFSRVGNRAKGIEQPTHKVISSLCCHLSDVSVHNKVYMSLNLIFLKENTR